MSSEDENDDDEHASNSTALVSVVRIANAAAKSQAPPVQQARMRGTRALNNRRKSPPRQPSPSVGIVGTERSSSPVSPQCERAVQAAARAAFAVHLNHRLASAVAAQRPMHRQVDSLRRNTASHVRQLLEHGEPLPPCAATLDAADALGKFVKQHHQVYCLILVAHSVLRLFLPRRCRRPEQRGSRY